LFTTRHQLHRQLFAMNYLRGAGCVLANMRPRAATDPAHADARFNAVVGSSTPQNPPEKSLLDAPLRKDAMKAVCVCVHVCTCVCICECVNGRRADSSLVC